MTRVSIIIPCYNEQARIGSLLEAISAQTYPDEDLEVIIADGMSTDGTREVVKQYSRAHPGLLLRLIENPKRSIPSAINAAVAAAQGEIILRLDGHSQPYPDYVERCIRDLQEDLGENVGGVWEIRPAAEGWVARSIAVAASHPLGVGDALYRHATNPAYVDTVPFGCFRRDLFLQMGGFDEQLLTNEDYDFNARIRQRGGRIWLDPQIRSIYYARETLGALARQYWRYGYWKFRMLRRLPSTLRWRQALPPILVLSLLLELVFSWVTPIRWIFIVELTIYLFALLAAGIFAAYRRHSISLIIGLPLAIGCMHLSWGTGFIWSMIAGDRVPPK
jgi:succinoglycan biosynthesis protein ExoA